MDGAEAVAILRAGGLIAAIEPVVVSDLPAGTVIDQEPSAGVRLKREAVVTLRLAVAPVDAPQASSDPQGEAAVEHVPQTGDADDTEDWFAALALAAGPAQRTGASGRRRRKHRRPSPSARELVFDPAPPPLVTAPAGSIVLPEGKRRGAGIWPLIGSAIYALPPTLAGAPLRRGAAVIAGLLLVALLGTRLFASGDRRARSNDYRAVGPTIHAQVVARRAVGDGSPRRRSAFRSRHAVRAGHARPRRARRPARASAAKAAPVSAIPAPRPNRSAGRESAASGARSTDGQFAYLGQ